MDSFKEMKTTDNLFIFLTMNVINKDNDIQDYVNINDKNIYLVKSKDNDLYFVVAGIFVLDADNEIRYDKSDSCLFVRNASTQKVKSINIHEIKDCIDTTSVYDYCQELEEICLEYIATKERFRKETAFDELITEFRKEVSNSINLIKELTLNQGEDYVEYAKRIVEKEQQIKQAKIILRITSVP